MPAREPGAVEPSAERAAALDRRMRERLEESLRYLVSEVSGPLDLDPALLEGFCERLRSGPVPPLAFGAYFELVLALENGDWEAARELLQEIAAAPNHAGGPVVLDLADPASDRGASRYHRLIDTDPNEPFQVLPPPPELARACRERISEAFELLGRGDPELAREIRGLLREIVLAVGPIRPGSMTFDGASSFMLWGAIVLNPRMFQSALEVAQALAHESGHNLLFGLCVDGSLVENDDEPRYTSPLRRDLRPMDGIVHATFVTARMHRSLLQLRASGALSGVEDAEAGRLLADHVRNFAMGWKIVDRDARLTERGKHVMADARRHMQAHAGA
ncbi:MAG: aKG-HExxH-type peptide beta-hydroxylase [Candidatus Limnocylindria bacterium]